MSKEINLKDIFSNPKYFIDNNLAYIRVDKVLKFFKNKIFVSVNKKAHPDHLAIMQHICNGALLEYSYGGEEIAIWHDFNPLVDYLNLHTDNPTRYRLKNN